MIRENLTQEILPVYIETKYFDNVYAAAQISEILCTLINELVRH